jgi:hypothetical protein
MRPAGTQKRKSTAPGLFTVPPANAYLSGDIGSHDDDSAASPPVSEVP